MTTEPDQNIKRGNRRYDAITRREFKSAIPPHLLAGLPEDERFMVDTVSKLENQFAWLADSAVKLSEITLDLDSRVLTVESDAASADVRLADAEKQSGKVEKLWEWKLFFSGKWAIIGGIVLMLLPAIIESLADFLFSLFKVPGK